MAITADHIRAVLTAYLDEHPEEKAALAAALDLLDSGADPTCRSEFRGHATAGAVLVRPDGRVLHIHHIATSRWLLPGGHLEAGDRTLLDAARRELGEETGIPVGAVTSVSDRPVHIDVHSIPASESKGEPEHQHIDFRFLFRTTAKVGELRAEEIAGAEWWAVDAIADQRLRHRVRRRPLVG